MSIVIITESGCDLTSDEARRAGVEIVPMYVIFGAQRMRDGFDIDRARFFARLANEQPQTEPPSVEDFKRAFARHIDADNDVICITMSSELSKSCANAREASSAFGARVRVIDSFGASGLQLLVVRYAAELRAGGASAVEIVERLGLGHLKRASYFAVPEVSSLGRSGRLAKPLVALGSMLGVSLVLKMNDSGAIGPAGQSRSFDKTCEIMVAALIRSIGRSPSVRIAVSHVEAAAVAASVAKRIEEELGFPPAFVSIHNATLTIATHLGTGAVGIFAALPA